MSKKMLIGVLVVCLAIIGVFVLNLNDKVSAPKETTKTVGSFDKSKYSTSQPGSIWWIVNKTRQLPEGYIPPDLIIPDVRLQFEPTANYMQFSKQAEPELTEMFNAAKRDNVELIFGSGYRSYDLQKQLYDDYVAKDGQAEADRYSARPGTSEHQTGLSFDAFGEKVECNLEICYADTAEGKWIKDNSYKYGFIIRYPSGKESVTGYQYEPWHLRYVGKELAVELQKTGQTMEEFFGLN
ncbi:MAG: M15 family metallopeptidase [Candidatus Saccharimonadales bacterium]